MILRTVQAKLTGQAVNTSLKPHFLIITNLAALFSPVVARIQCYE
jgi:hypothetical protein